MTKIFYDHLVKFEEITEEINKYQIEAVEREEIIQLADETVHHRVLMVILDNLSKEKQQEFLVKFHQGPQEKNLLNYLKKEISDIEEIISHEAIKVKKELLSEIKRA